MTSGGLVLALLDSGPLGLITHPRGGSEALKCQTWLADFLAAGNAALVPEICYYEMRRELRRSELKNGVPSRGLVNLEALTRSAGLVPITSGAIVTATEFWAEARHKRLQGAPDLALDADMILCAQAKLLDPVQWDMEGAEVLIVTENVRHLENFAEAIHWRDIVL